jgi:ABC-2 type transport system ATP-binding protein
MGMKQRLGIAAALLGDPELIILDEPTNGLDPVGMQDVRRLIGEIANGGRTILVSSHLLGSWIRCSTGGS